MFSFGGGPDAREYAEHAQEKDRRAEREVGVGVDLLHVPGAGGYCDEEAHEVQEREAKDGVPGERVADSSVEGIRLVLVEAEDVGAGFGAGEAAAQGCDACAAEDRDRAR